VGLNAYAQFFMYWKGGIRQKFFQANMTNRQTGVLGYMTAATSTPNPATIIPGLAVTTPTTPFLQLECPYYYRQAYQATTADFNSAASQTSNIAIIPNNAFNNWYKADSAADDFTFFVQKPLGSGFHIKQNNIGDVFGLPGYFAFTNANTLIPEKEEPSEHILPSPEGSEWDDVGVKEEDLKPLTIVRSNNMERFKQLDTRDLVTISRSSASKMGEPNGNPFSEF